MRRRDFMVAFAGAAACPTAGRAQSKMPVIGFLNSASPAEFEQFAEAFRQGLNDGGYADGRNVTIEYRWAMGQYDRLPKLAADLVQRQVAVLAATGGLQPAVVAKAASKTIPILFVIGVDPVKSGLVASFNRPGGNATGASVFSVQLISKRVELLNELVPKIPSIALLLNANSAGIEGGIQEMEVATRVTGQRAVVLKVRNESDFEDAFASAVQQGASALVSTADAFLTERRAQIVALAQKYRLPAMYPWREYVEAGGLMSYGQRISLAYRQIGVYASRILNGAKPADLPVQAQPKMELVINLNAAKALGINVPRLMLLRATDIIE
jgi:putative tryptophan/tyrosine transport system substrate-binding protein